MPKHSRPWQFLRSLHRRFRSGPEWIDLPDFLRKKEGKYQSPTLLMLAWAYAIYVRVLTVPGRMIISTVGLLLFYSLIIEGPTRIFAFIVLALLAVDVLAGFVFRPRLSISRKLPERARAGSPVHIEYNITNLRKLPAWNLRLDPIGQQKWLKFEADIASLDYVPPRGSVRARACIQTERRGEYVLKPPIASAAFPFGIVKWTCSGGSSQRLLIYPAFEPLNSLSLPLSSRLQREGLSMVSRVGESQEFHACRDFRTGDNAKHIHWPTTARRGQLIVREFQEEFLCRVAVVLDTFIRQRRFFCPSRPRKGHPRLEAALALTAALSHKLAHGDYVVDIFAAGPSVYHFKGGRSLAQIDQILDILACVESEVKDPMPLLSGKMLDEISGIGSAVLLLLGWDQARKELVESLGRHGIALKVVILGDQADAHAGRAPENCIFISPEQVLSGQIRDL
ncbi:MAG: DUF58 domain-containing protein [Victivallales bacterium]|nr:DUF58 domain-containing protein [Victivallales bacterium]